MTILFRHALSDTDKNYMKSQSGQSVVCPTHELHASRIQLSSVTIEVRVFV